MRPALQQTLLRQLERWRWWTCGVYSSWMVVENSRSRGPLFYRYLSDRPLEMDPRWRDQLVEGCQATPATKGLFFEADGLSGAPPFRPPFPPRVKGGGPDQYCIGIEQDFLGAVFCIV